jgi:hypothetical protein
MILNYVLMKFGPRIWAGTSSGILQALIKLRVAFSDENVLTS